MVITGETARPVRVVATCGVVAHLCGMVNTPDTRAPVPDSSHSAKPEATPHPGDAPPLPPEIGGAPGPEPTRYGDWQHKGRVTDF